MVVHRLTVFEVFDNFFGTQDCPEAERLNNAKIRELREHIINFYGAYEIPPCGEHQTRLYLGGFLSSPPFSTEASPFISSALLCSDSIILFDPLHYWFCDEQYRRPRLLSAPTGWKNLETRRPDYSLTKRYLAKAFAWMYELRPLVDAGIVVLIPAEQLVYAHLDTIMGLAKGITGLLKPIEGLAQDFPPEEITVDDNRKGLFTFAGGDREKQIRKSIRRGLEYFAKDVLVANASGSIYTAPFRWEQRLGKASFDGFAATEYHATLVEGVRNLRLPILANLSPEVLVKIHRDSKYTEFRAVLGDALLNVHAEIGSQDFVDQVAQIEKDILFPKLEAIYQETQSSGFKAATKAIREGFLTFTQSFLGKLATGADIESHLRASAVAGGLSFLRHMFKEISKSRDHRVWAQLLPEKPSLSAYYQAPLKLKHQGDNSSWEIDERPSMKIRVAGGIVKPPLV